MTNRRIVWILLVVFVLLVAATMLQKRESQPEPTEPTPVPTASFTRLFPDMAVLDIQAIRLMNPNTGVTFDISREADGTWIALDGDGVLDQSAARSVAEAIVLMPYGRSLPLTDETNLQDFGFDPKGLLFVVVLLADGRQHAMAVGGLTPSKEEHYVVADEREEIFLVPRGPIDLLIKTFVSPPLT
jgi:hypothetical protein